MSNSFNCEMRKWGLGITESFQAYTANVNTADYRSLPAYTGNWGFYFSEDMLNAGMEFRTSSHLGLTINEISWEGQFHNVAKGV